MGNTVLHMSMSSTVSSPGPDESTTNPLGVDGEVRLLVRRRGERCALVDEMNATGAGLAGRRNHELVNGWDGSHHGAPLFVVTHTPRETTPPGASSFTFVTDGVRSAVEKACAAAGDVDVMVHGADMTQR